MSRASAKDLKDRHLQRLSLDIPKGDIDSRYSAHLSAAVSGMIGKTEHRLPVTLDLSGITTYQQRPKVIVNRRFNS
jgi:hypothetical protein